MSLTVGKGEGRRDGLARRQFGAILIIEVPAPAKGLATFIEQHPVLLAQGAVEELHPVVGVALPAITGVRKCSLSTSVAGMARPAAQLFSWLARRHSSGLCQQSCRPDVLRAEPPVSRANRPAGALIESQVTDAMARLAEGRREGAHGGKEGQHLLAVVAAVVGFGAAPPSGSRPPDPACETSCDRRSTDRQVPGAAPSDWFPLC